MRIGGRHTIVPEKCDDEVVAQGEQVHGIAEEVGDPVVLLDKRHEEELQDVEEDPDGEEGADGDLSYKSVSRHASSRRDVTHVETIPKLQPFFAAHRWSEESLSSFPEDAAHEEEHCC